MDLDFNLLETGCLFFSILVTTFTLQVMFISLFCTYADHDSMDHEWLVICTYIVILKKNK
jgi:ABC-type glycerol-3-phosphate transport system permease component